MVNNKQKGASLFVALIMLVVLTILAVSSMRGVVLESRITGSMVLDSKLFNQAETTLSDIENRIDLLQAPMQSCTNNNNDSICIKNSLLNTVIAPGFDYLVKPYATELIDFTGPKIEKLKSSWYAIPAPAGETEGESLNPEYGQTLRGIGTFMYEVTVKSNMEDNVNENIYIRTVYSKEFGG